MLTLAINTATRIESVVLLKEKKILAEKTWRAAYDETEKLLPAITHLLKKAGVSFQNLNRIVVIAGPGPFSAVRIGVTVANVLSFLLKIPLFTIDARTFWRLRTSTKNAILMLHAGGKFVARYDRNHKEKISPAEKAFQINKKKLTFFGELTAEQMKIFETVKDSSWKFVPVGKLMSFAKIMSGIQSSLLKKKKMVAPLYFKPPHITRPKPFSL